MLGIRYRRMDRYRYLLNSVWLHGKINDSTRLCRISFLNQVQSIRFFWWCRCRLSRCGKPISIPYVGACVFRILLPPQPHCYYYFMCCHCSTSLWLHCQFTNLGRVSFFVSCFFSIKASGSHHSAHFQFNKKKILGFYTISSLFPGFNVQRDHFKWIFIYFHFHFIFNGANRHFWCSRSTS